MRRILLTALLLAFLAGASACSATAEGTETTGADPAPTGSADPDQTDDAANPDEPSEQTTQDDAEVAAGPIEWAGPASDVDFWAATAIVGDEVEGYSTVEEMTDAATAVVIGTVTSVGEGRTIVDPDVPEDKVTYPAINVEVLRVLAGELPVVEGNTILVEPLGGAVTSLEPPKGAVLLFLRYKGEGYDLDTDLGPAVEGDLLAYRWVSSSGLFIERNGVAFNPIAERHHDVEGDEPEVGTQGEEGEVEDPIAAEYEGSPIDELIAEVEAAAG